MGEADLEETTDRLGREDNDERSGAVLEREK
jgi:hypothetical protein